MATIGNTAKPTSGMVMTSLNNQNQVALKVTMPQAGTITRVGVWCAGNNADATMKVCVWNSSGNLLRASNSFDANGQTLVQGNSSNYERDLTSPLNVNDGQVLYIGFSADPTEARQWGINGSGTHYRDTSGSQGADANFGSFSGSIGAYAEYSTAPTNVRPDAPTINYPKGGNVQSSSPNWPQLNFTHHDDDGDPISGYDIDLDNNSGFGSIVWDAFNASSGISGDDVNRTPSGTAAPHPQRGTQYYWRARTRDAVGAGDWSGTYSFIINSLPVATKVAPLPGGLAFIHNLGTDLSVWTAGGAHAKPRFQWSYSDAESQPQKQFQVKVWSADGLTLLHDSGPITSTATLYDAPWALVHDQVYQWSVEVFDSIEWSVLAKSTFKVKWAQAIYESGVLPASTQWAFSSVKAGSGQAALLYATATGLNGAGRSAWNTDIGSLTPAARLNVLVRLAAQTGTAPTLTSMKFSYFAGTPIYPDNWLRVPSASGWSISTDVVRFGSQSIRCAVSSAVDHSIRPFRGVAGLAVADDHMPVKGATTYVFSAYIKSTGPMVGSNKIALEVYPAGSALPIPAHAEQPTTDYETQDTVGKGDRDWQRLHYVFTTPVDVTEVDCFIKYRNVGAAATNDTFYVDGSQLESGNVVTAWSPGQIGAGAAVIDVQGVQVDAQQGGVLRLQAASGGQVALSTDPAAGAMRFTDFLRIERMAASDKIIEGHTGTQPHFDIQRDGKLTWRNPVDGTLLASLGIGGGVDANALTLIGQRLEAPVLWAVEADDIRNGNSSGQNYPAGLSWFEITNSSAAGWPQADGRGFVITFRKGNTPIQQIWLGSGALAVASRMWVRGWNQVGAAWRAWVQAA